MAKDLRTVAVPGTTTVTLTNANEAYGVHVPRECGVAALTPHAHPAQFAYSGTEGDPLVNAYHPVPADGMTPWPVKAAQIEPDGALSRPDFFLQTATPGAIVAVSLLPKSGLLAE